MMRSKDKKPKDRPDLYLLHIPKTAGTTIAHYLRGYYTFKDVLPYLTWNHFLPVLKKRQLKSKKSLVPKKHKLILGHFGVSILPEIPKHNVITMLRHPLERTISQYYHMEFDPTTNNWVKPGFIKPTDTLSKILNDPKRQIFFANTQSRYLSRRLDMRKLALSRYERRQAIYYDSLPEFLDPDQSDVKLFKQAVASLDEMYWFGIQEYFQESLISLAWRLDWPIKHDHDRQQSVWNRPSAASLPASGRNKILKLNQADLALYKLARNRFIDQYLKLLRAQLKTVVSAAKFKKERTHLNRHLIDSVTKSGWTSAARDLRERANGKKS